MNYDKNSSATARNVIEKSHLDSELKRIEKEEKAEMRMHNTSKQRFKAKYLRLDDYTNDGIVEAPDVRLYETHNPGFCYRRNGERRIPQIVYQTVTVDFKNIHDMLFTDGELDIEKVVCLHLLAAHKTETLTPPSSRYNRTSYLSREQSPLERLIERSRKRHQTDNLTKLLPTYVLDFASKQIRDEGSGMQKNDVVIRDGRLAARIIINDKIVQLVHTVLAALHNSNKEKMRNLLALAMDQDELRNMIERPQIQEFVKKLSGQSMIYSCDSFHLTPPFKTIVIPLQIQTTTGVLENLIMQIRKEVFQVRATTKRKDFHLKAQPITKNESITNVKEPRQPKSKDSFSAELFDPPSKNFKVLATKPKRPQVRNSPVYPPKKTEMKQPPTCTPNFLKYFETSVPRLQKPSNKIEEAASFESNSLERKIETLIKDIDAKIMAARTGKSTPEPYGFDIASLMFTLSNPDKPIISPKLSESSNKPGQEKISIKKMNCTACREKWKTPFPKPKVPNYKRVTIPTINQTGVTEYKTTSGHRLSLLIDQEMDRLKTSFRKVSPQNPEVCKRASRRSRAQREVLGEKPSLSGFELNSLDLAKITQEIQEIETTKKLRTFLATKI